uniref:Pyruvate kinase n=1 Tax=Dermatophagoides pteronyssinus TaxID=6956 RepID=A0A6P6Y502_DERPT|nr:pyruvate kinase-like [Dermatophagoides pteronyssinus]
MDRCWIDRGIDIKCANIFADQGAANEKRKTKIVCTLGPACWSVENLLKLIDAGMDVARFNFSHGDHASHQACLDRLHEAMKQRPHKRVCLMLDTKGPEIRTGDYEDGISSCEFKKGEKLRIVTDYGFKGNSACIATTYKKLPTTVKKGAVILIADGSLSVEVTACGPDYVDTLILNNAKFGSRKNMNLPGAKVELPVCGEREINDITKFGLPNLMTSIAVSFVQSPQDVLDFRKQLGEKGKHIMIIPKIENAEGVRNLEKIVEVSDGIMVARGDLGMEIPLSKVFLAQKHMIDLCNKAGKPVIVATQMLESMISNPRPTRAEVGDVANAVLDGADAVMLSGESANGLFFDRAVQYLEQTSYEAECCFNYAVYYNTIALQLPPTNPLENLVYNAVRVAYGAQCEAMITVTNCGTTAQLMAKFRSSQRVIVGTTCDCCERLWVRA